MNGCNTFIFDSLPEKELIPRFEISSFHWERDGYSRPESSVRFCAVKNEGYYAFLESSESPVLARYTRRDDPVYTDSCLEVFIAPVSGRREYINFEMNPNGAYLSQFGSERNGRVFIKELTAETPRVSAGVYPDTKGWHAELFIPESLISAPTAASFRSRRARFAATSINAPTTPRPRTTVRSSPLTAFLSAFTIPKGSALSK